MPVMKVDKLESTEGFLVWDLPDAPVSVGPTRLGAKLLASNATMYARQITYSFAALERQAGGATAGIRAADGDRDDAIAAYCAEVEPLVADGKFRTSAHLRLSDDDLAPLLANDERAKVLAAVSDGLRLDDELVGLGAAVAAETAFGLDGKTVAIEGFAPAGIALARAVEDRGASIGRISSGAGTASGSVSSTELTAAWAEYGEAMVANLGSEPGKPWEVYRGEDIDICFVCSKPGVLSGEGAGALGSTAVVPYGPAPISTKALAVLRRAGAPALADFVNLVGPLLAGSGSTADDLRAATAETVSLIVDEVKGHEDGAVLGACYRAEAFMSTWLDELPFGRPLG